MSGRASVIGLSSCSAHAGFMHGSWRMVACEGARLTDRLEGPIDPKDGFVAIAWWEASSISIRLARTPSFHVQSCPKGGLTFAMLLPNCSPIEGVQRTSKVM